MGRPFLRSTASPPLPCRNEEKRREDQRTQQAQRHARGGQEGRDHRARQIDVGGQTVTAAITNESAEELKLAAGMTVYAVIKASDVMVGID